MNPLALNEVASHLRDAQRVFVITGAGISAESGIPTFRGQGGLWEGFRAEELATPEAFAADPVRVWRWYRWRAEAYGECAPNPAHDVIAQMERQFDAFLIATQNVDGLHRRAGNQAIVELHGTIAQMRCTGCGFIGPFPKALTDGENPVPRCSLCGSMMRPHILWFGETYWPGVLEAAEAMAQQADVCLVIGTSAQVWPPVALALLAQRSGATLVDVNLEATSLSNRSDYFLKGKASEVLVELWDAVLS
jgi:NAD-dependent deacetylase